MFVRQIIYDKEAAVQYKRLALASIVLVIVAAALVAADRPPASHFEFELRRTDTGVALKNHYGGDWISLTGDCTNPKQTCVFVVNEHGIRTFPEAETSPSNR
jgi:hypothetical protein